MKVIRAIKNFITAGMAFLILFMMAVPVFAAEDAPLNQSKTVRMGYFEFGGMFEGAEEDAVKSGYCYEYMMQVATYTGWNYEFCYGSYSELYDMLRDGEIDILPYTNYNNQRGSEVLFSDKALAEEEYYIAVIPGEITSPQALDGAVISTLKGADYNRLLLDYIEENGLDLTVKYYPNLEETWEAVRDGRADATVFTSNAYSNDGWNCICSFGKKPTYIAVAKDNPDLLEDLNEATRQIDTDNPALLGELYAYYFSNNPMQRSLTAEEQEWVNRHPVIHVGGFENDAPYFLSVDNEKRTATGLTVDVMNDIIERLNLEVMVDFRGYHSLDEMEAALDSGEIDVILPFYTDYYLAQEHNLVISNTVRVSNMELVYKNGTSYREALSKVATPATKLGIYYVRDTFPDSEIVGADSIQDAVDKVLSGEASGAIAQNVVLHNIQKKYDNLNYVVLSRGCGTCFAARYDNYPLIRILNRGLNCFSEAEIASIASLYNPEPDVSTRAFLASHKELIILIIVVFVLFLILLAALLQVSRLRKKADEASKSKTSFLFNMSHDIRTPLNAITGFTAMAKKNVNDEKKVSEYLEKIDISGRQLISLVNQILEMARIESGKLEIINGPVDIRKEYEFAVTVLSEQARAKGLDFHASFEDMKHEYVLADAARLSSITMNIAGNAMKYTPSGGRIDFLLKEIPSKKEGYAAYIFTVEDTGIGMSKEYRKVLFEPFTREKSSTVSKIQGAGLGLSIVKSLVDMMDGKIEVQSEPGKGTRFDITLEFMIDEAAENNTGEDSEQLPDMSLFRDRKVLLVDDNELNREIAADVLNEEGLVVEEADDGSKAVELLREKGPDYYDFILMDIQMPVMGGYKATAMIREMYPEKHIPVVALSANAFAEDKAASLAAGMDDHVAKPLDVRLLFNVLAKFL